MQLCVLVVVLVALGGCGGPAAADGEPRKALTKKGQATAKSIVLKRGDLTAAFSARPRTDDKPS